MGVQERNIPVHLITGFLGSGKTTLLTRLIDYYHAVDQKVAVVMNELGDVNLDGTLMNREVPMSEMLGGCICCSIRGDLGMEIQELIATHRPDVILIESTGAANPLEIIDGVTEAALLVHVDLQSIITIVDGPELLERGRNGKGATFRLMKEQIRCATHLIVNKADRLYPEQVVEVQQLVRGWNEKAELFVTVKAVVDAAALTSSPVKEYGREQYDATVSHSHDDNGGNTVTDVHCCADDEHDHAHCGQHDEAAEQQEGHMHHSHSHVMVLTHYFPEPVDGEAFEALLNHLPDDIYRAKGVVTFKETKSRFMFQYAYRESDFLRINPQGQVHDVAVFIGEHFSREQLLEQLHELEKKSAMSGEN
ncbi:CobW family GTP-binding protein [Paenibacillus sp. GCM10012307]|uniref:GTP-binding protein n=1 Tax=Paenibacillus roseus TaxID=2798579 RepID=A0A934MP89_9BACL|nr:GTP-binding protein [Paenibacillus roseus]MBJ6360174.1 GTP-binding protein [Paenibacillus roseus]